MNTDWFPLLVTDDEGTEWTPALQAGACEICGRSALVEGRKLDGTVRFICLDHLPVIRLNDTGVAGNLRLAAGTE